MKKRNPASPPESSSSSSAAQAANDKRIKLNLLEERLRVLEEENQTLKSQLRVGKEPVEIDEHARELHTEVLERLLADPKTPQEDIKAALKQYVIRFSDYGPVRSQIVEKHMEQLDRLLAPTQLSKLVMWSMQRHNLNDDVDQDQLRDELWDALCEEISATEEQKAQFEMYRENMVHFTKELQITNQECQDLRVRLQEKNRAFGAEMADLTHTLSPRQLAVFVLFVSKNHANSAMLSRLWDSELKRVMKARAAE